MCIFYIMRENPVVYHVDVSFVIVTVYSIVLFFSHNCNPIRTFSGATTDLKYPYFNSVIKIII
ncbi:hypothetical protein KUTeg_023746 [Tegillarca granosa]|uniref:Uncharacterized protein n=1 Tax=Tegillarca granosa TaxID=220873 RepID=A0ABQ9E5H6_TEGGR|nr:hypothetical protein KUTeg_023746 [Tegillarca granosa]